MKTQLNLGLDQALIEVHPNISDNPNLRWPIEIYYQLIECVGCKGRLLTKFHLQSNSSSQFVIGTKYPLHLEIKGFPHFQATNYSQSSCSINGLSLENQAHYSLELADPTYKPIHPYNNCSIRKIKNGPIDYGWLFGSLALILVISYLEAVYVRLRSKKKRSTQTSDRALVYHRSDPTTEENDVISTQIPGRNTISRSQNQVEGEILDQPRSRLDCLDVFRGITIIGMIMVNYGGAGYLILEHKPWDGLSPADLVFPFFIFSMGASIAISIRSLHLHKQKSIRSIMIRILKRSMWLILIGLILNSQVIEVKGIRGLRIFGILQRLGISYRIVATCYAIELFVSTSLKQRQDPLSKKVLNWALTGFSELVLGSICIIIYLYFTYQFDYDSHCPPGYTGPGGLTQAGIFENCTGGAAGWLDRKLLGENHLYKDPQLNEIFGSFQAHDPEGFLGYTTSIVLTVFGLNCGRILIDKNRETSLSSRRRKIMSLSRWICFLTVASGISSHWIPINKNLWSLTFVTITGCLAFIFMTLLYILLDIIKCHRGFFLQLCISASKNSLFLYIGHSLIHKMLPWWFPVNNNSRPELLFQLLWSIFVWLVIGKYLDNRRLYIRL